MKHRLLTRTSIATLAALLAFLAVLPLRFLFRSIAFDSNEPNVQLTLGVLLFVWLAVMFLLAFDLGGAHSPQGDLDRLVNWKQRISNLPWRLRIRRGTNRTRPPVWTIPLDQDIGFEHLLEQKRSGAWDRPTRKSWKRGGSAVL